MIRYGDLYIVATGAWNQGARPRSTLLLPNLTLYSVCDFLKGAVPRRVERDAAGHDFCGAGNGVRGAVGAQLGWPCSRIWQGFVITGRGRWRAFFI